jgi:uncharacterized spore protein YtfJ
MRPGVDTPVQGPLKIISTKTMRHPPEILGRRPWTWARYLTGALDVLRRAEKISYTIKEQEHTMDEVANLMRISLEEIEKVLTGRTVVGDAVTHNGNTLIPLVRITFGFAAGGGAGGGTGKAKSSKGEASGGAGAGGASIKPVAVIIINETGVKVEPITGATGSVLGKASDMMGRVIDEHLVKRGKDAEAKEE